MNAIQFIQQNGVDKAREVVKGAPEWAIFWISRNQYHGSVITFPNMTDHYSVDLVELKRLVESVDMINRCGGLVIAKKITFQKRLRNEKATHFIQHPENQKLIQLFGRNQRKPEAAIKFDLFEQAIADYEAIGGEHV